MMKKVLIEKPGNYDKLLLKEFPTPKPGKGQVLIETKACGVNFADCLIRMGVYKSAQEFVGWPITPGFEVAGVVAATGEGVEHLKVEHLKVGEKVVALTLFGGYTTHLVVDARQVFPLPEGLSFEQGASLPTVFLTAYYALFDLANCKKGDCILVHSAGGGVGSTLVQFGKLAGCTVVGVVGAAHKVDYVKELKADQVIDKSAQDLWKEARRIAPKGYDVILDANGVETLKESYRHLAPGGKLVVYGFHTLFSKGRGTPNWFKLLWQYFQIPKFNPFDMVSDNHSVLAFNLSYLTKMKEFPKDDIEKLLNWVKQGKVVLPQITTYPLEQVAEAQRSLETGKTVGKIVLTT